MFQFGGRIASSSRNFSLLLRPSIHWLRPTQIIEGNLLYLKSVDYKCRSQLNSIFTAADRLLCNQQRGAVVQPKLTRTVNCHTGEGCREHLPRAERHKRHHSCYVVVIITPAVLKMFFCECV